MQVEQNWVSSWWVRLTRAAKTTILINMNFIVVKIFKIIKLVEGVMAGGCLGNNKHDFKFGLAPTLQTPIMQI